VRKKFSIILSSIFFIFSIQNYSYSQNIFDELKKATDQIQKDLEKPNTKQPPVATPAPAPATPKAPVATPAPAPATPKTPVATSAPKSTTPSAELKNFKSSLPICEGSDSTKFDKCKGEEKSGVHYIGEFKNGKFHGKGIMLLKSGYIYEGNFENDAPYGDTTEIHPVNGQKLVGKFNKKGFHGKVVLISSDGKNKENQEWKDGERIK
jgi:hypothetical protein